MKYTKLGNSDLNVSRICMGCMGFGDNKNGQHSWTVDESDSRRIIRRGLELGVNFFDTAIGYQSGTSEQYLGRAIRDFAKRDDVVIATKFLPRTDEEIAAGITGQQHIRQMLDRSLRNGDRVALTLLEHGHALVGHNGDVLGTVGAKPHIRPAEQKAEKDENEIHKGVQVSRKVEARQIEEIIKERPPLCRRHFQMAKDWMKVDFWVLIWSGN